MTKCPSCKTNEAIIDKTYGVTMCQSCRDKGTGIKKKEGGTLAKSHRVQQARDIHAADLIQPYLSGKPNRDYFEMYPEQIKKYNVAKELEKL